MHTSDQRWRWLAQRSRGWWAALFEAWVKTVELVTVTMWSSRLLRVDLLHGWWQLYWSPYRPRFARTLMARRNGLGPDELVYGETPWCTARHMLREVDLRPGELFLDLGAGDGRLALYAAMMAGARVRGVELVPELCRLAQALHTRFDVAVEMQCGDVATASVEDADVVYLPWTCFGAETRQRLTRRLFAMKAGARIIAATFPIDDQAFELLDIHRVWFNWGRGRLHYYRRR